MALSNTSSASSTSESHAITPIHHTATKSEWMEAIEQQHLERSTLNRLIINYLITGKIEYNIIKKKRKFYFNLF
jgi:hypothetical protein